MIFLAFEGIVILAVTSFKFTIFYVFGSVSEVLDYESKRGASFSIPAGVTYPCVLIHHYVRVHFFQLYLLLYVTGMSRKWMTEALEQGSKENSLATVMFSVSIYCSEIWTVSGFINFFVAVHSISCLSLECSYSSTKLLCPRNHLHVEYIYSFTKMCL